MVHLSQEIKNRIIMEKSEFMLLSTNDATRYIEEHYDMDDICDACEDFIEEISCDYTEYEFDELIQSKTSYQFLIETLSGDDLKEYLWDNVVEWCEQIEEEED